MAQNEQLATCVCEMRMCAIKHMYVHGMYKLQGLDKGVEGQQEIVGEKAKCPNHIESPL